MKAQEKLFNDEFLSKVKTDKDNDFICCMVKNLDAYLPVFKFDALAINFVTAKQCHLESHQDSVVYQMDKLVIPYYHDNIKKDIFTPNLISSLGKLVTSDHIMAYERWEEQNFFKTQCKPFDIHQSLSLMFPIPNWQSRFIVFHFTYAEYRKLTIGLGEFLKIEYACVLFWQCWLYRHRQMCYKTLTQRFELLSKVNPAELRTLKLLVNYPTLTVDQLSALTHNKLNPLYPICSNTIKDHKAKISVRIHDNENKRLNRELLLFSRFCFLQGCL